MNRRNFLGALAVAPVAATLPKPEAPPLDDACRMMIGNDGICVSPRMRRVDQWEKLLRSMRILEDDLI